MQGINVLTAEDVAVIRGERLIFRHVSFSVPSGGALVLSGPNGSGKSTLLRLLAGLGRAAAGRLLWNGVNALADLAEHGRRVAYVGHQDAVKPGLLVAENLRFAAAVSHRPILPALSAVGLQALSRAARADAVGRPEAPTRAVAAAAVRRPAVVAR